MTLGEILNLVECGLSSVLGTGIAGCKQFIRKTTSVWLVPDGFEFDSSVKLDLAYAQQLQAEGNLIVLKDAKTFEDQSSDDQIDTLEDGTEQVATEGLYKFSLMFINGLAFHAALTSLNSFGSYNALFVDKDGNILGTKADSGQLKGFSLNMLQANRLQFASDSTGQREGITMQLARRRELDSDYVYVSNTQLDGFNPQNLDGINEVVVSYDTTPTDGATELVVKAVMKQNAKPFQGADDLALWTITVAGATVTPSGVAEGTGANVGKYTFTVSAVSTGQASTAALYDTANSRIAISLGSALYKSNTASTTVVA